MMIQLEGGKIGFSSINWLLKNLKKQPINFVCSKGGLLHIPIKSFGVTQLSSTVVTLGQFRLPAGWVAYTSHPSLSKEC